MELACKTGISDFNQIFFAFLQTSVTEILFGIYSISAQEQYKYVVAAEECTALGRSVTCPDIQWTPLNKPTVNKPNRLLSPNWPGPEFLLNKSRRLISPNRRLISPNSGKSEGFTQQYCSQTHPKYAFGQQFLPFIQFYDISYLNSAKQCHNNVWFKLW